MGMYNKERLTREDIALKCPKGSSMTKQSQRDECDINKILAKVQKGATLEHLMEGEPFYGDVSGLVDYQQALNIMREADALFMKMDAKIRERFENDPAKMISFLDDESNYDEAVKLGMVVDKREAKPSVSVGDATKVETVAKP